MSTNSRTVEELLRALLRGILQLVDADLGGFFVYDEMLQRVELGTIEGIQSPPSFPSVRVIRLSPQAVPAERWILRHRRPLHLYQPRHWQMFPPVNPGLRLLAERNTLSALVLPLRWGPDQVGVAYLWRHQQPRPFSRDEIRQAKKWCEIAAIVAVASRLYQQERTLRSNFQHLLAMNRELTATISFETFGPLVAQLLQEFLDAQAVILLISPPDQWQPLSFSVGVPEELVPQVANSFVPSPNLGCEADLMLRYSRTQALELWPVLAEILPSQSEFVLLPIRERTSTLGLVLAWWENPPDRSFPQFEEVLSVLLQQISATVLRLTYQMSLQRTIGHLDALHSVARVSTLASNVSDLLHEVERVFRARIRYDAMLFLEPDPDSFHHLVVVWGSGSVPETEVGHRIPIGQSLAGNVFVAGQPLKVPDSWADPRTYHRPGRLFPFRSLLLLPVQHEQRTLGVLGFGRFEVDPFTEAEQQLASLITEEVAKTLVLIQHRQTLDHQARMQRLLADVSNLLVRSESPRDYAQPLVSKLAAELAAGVALVIRCPLYPHCIFVTEGLSEDSARILKQFASRDFFEWLAQTSRDNLVPLHGTVSWPEPWRSAITQLVGAYQKLVLTLLTPDAAPSGFLLIGTTDSQKGHQASDYLLRQIGDRIQTSLERWTLKLEDLWITNFALSLGHSPTPEVFAENLLKGVGELILNDFAAVLQLHSATQVAVPLACTPASSPSSAKISFPPGDLPSKLLTERASYFPDSEDDREIGHALRLLSNERPSSLLAASIRAEDDTLLLLLGRYGKDRFHAPEQRRLDLLVASVTSAWQLVCIRARERALYLGSIEAFAAAIDAKDPTTHSHSRRVARIARQIATRMGLPREQVDSIELAALLHDIGKFAIPDAVLRKPGRLDEAEWSLIRTHPIVAAEILGQVPQLTPIIPLIRSHHERWDGQGYPDGLKGNEIPLGAAIIGLADAFDTMTSARPYHVPRSLSEALEEVQRCKGSQFHPEVVDTFVQLFHEPEWLAQLLGDLLRESVQVLSLQALTDIGKQIEHTHDISTLAELIDIVLSGRLSNDNIVIFLLDREKETLSIVYSRHDTDLAQQIQLPRGRGLAWQVVETNQPIMVDLEHDKPENIVLWERRQVRFILSAPLVDGQGPIGALTLSRTTPHPFRESDLRLLATLGRFLGPLLQTHRRELLATHREHGGQPAQPQSG